MNATTTSPPPTLREKQRKEREELILQAAEEVLLEKGYHAMSMEEIAMRVGIAKGTLYLHFDRKDDLIFHLLDRDLQHLPQVLEQSVLLEGTAQTKLTVILEALYQGFFGKHGQLFSILYNSLEIKAALRERLGSVLHTVAERVKALLEEGKEEGLFDPALSTEVMTSIFFSMLSPRAYHHLVKERRIAPEDLARQVGSIFFRGIRLCPSGTEAPEHR